jgi:hypothetical protein
MVENPDTLRRLHRQALRSQDINVFQEQLSKMW